MRPPDFILPTVFSEAVRGNLMQHGAQNSIMPQSVGRDFSVAEADVDPHEHTTGRMIHTRLDVSAGHIIKMSNSSDQLP